MILWAGIIYYASSVSNPYHYFLPDYFEADKVIQGTEHAVISSSQGDTTKQIGLTSHFLVFVVLSLLVSNAIQQSSTIVSVWWAFPVSVAYAILDEFHQTYVPGRTFEFLDIILDTIGSLAGILIFLVLVKIIKRHTIRI